MAAMEISRATVLLTGASGGLGHAIARHLAARGAELVLTGRQTELLQPLADELSARVIAADLSDRSAVAGLIDEVGDVDILVANAALPASGALLDYSQEQIDRALDVNLRAPIMLAHALAPAMVQRHSGHLVFISSLSGKTGQAGSSLYSATKFGLRGFAQGLRGDLAPAGVGVSTVFPGFIRDAGLFHNSGAELPRGVGTSTPDQVAAAVVRGITKNRGELTVAPVTMRLGATLGSVAPETALRVARLSGGDRVSSEIAGGQEHLR